MTNWLRLARAPVDPLRFLTDLSRTEGDVARVRVGPLVAWLLSHPDDVERVLTDTSGRLSKGKGVEGPKRLLGEGLLTTEGELHDRRRPLVEQAFNPDALQARATAHVERHAAALADRWQPGQTIDAFDEMRRLALTVGVQVFLGEAGPAAAAVGAAFDSFDRLTLPFVAPVGRLPLPSNRRFEVARREVDRVLADLTEARRRQPGDDLASVLVATGMPDGAVRDEVMNLFSGHKSVGVALTWVLYLLAQHPDALDRAEPRQVVAESMRLYPPIWVLARKVQGSPWTTVDGTAIEPGAMVIVSAWVTHRDPRFHDDPERFDPGRPAAAHPYAYFPFGGGPRGCVGEALAWLELTTVLATLGWRWRFRVAPGQEVELAPRVTLKPKRGVPLVVERRSNASP